MRRHGPVIAHCTDSEDFFKCVRLSRLLAFECTLNHCTFIHFIHSFPENSPETEPDTYWQWQISKPNSMHVQFNEQQRQIAASVLTGICRSAERCKRDAYTYQSVAIDDNSPPPLRG